MLCKSRNQMMDLFNILLVPSQVAANAGKMRGILSVLSGTCSNPEVFEQL
jgi:hypothetical protein